MKSQGMACSSSGTSARRCRGHLWFDRAARAGSCTIEYKCQSLLGMRRNKGGRITSTRGDDGGMAPLDGAMTNEDVASESDQFSHGNLTSIRYAPTWRRPPTSLV